jgi:hypothetical protein
VIQIESANPHHDHLFICCGAGDFIQQLVVELGVHCRRRSAKVGKVSMKLRTVIGNESFTLKRRVRRDDDDALRLTFDQAPGKFRHSVDRSAYFGNRIASNLRHHDWRMRGNAGEY